MCITELRKIPAGERHVRAFVKDRLGGVKAPTQAEVWPDLTRSKVGKVLKADIKSRLPARPGAPWRPAARGNVRLVPFGMKI